MTFEKATHTLSPKRVVIPIKYDVNEFRNFTLSHNETSTAKIDHKNEINAKNWVVSTWVAKSQHEKSTLGQQKSQWSMLVKVNDQRQKSTVNARADMAVTCLGLTWRPGGVACGSEEVLACAGE